MKWSYLLVVSLLMGAAPARAEEPPAFRRVRALDSWAMESLERVVARSAVGRRLIQQLQASDLIVHIVTVTVLPANLAGATCFVSQQGGHRYVRVSLDRQLLPDSRAAILGHELQHALEIAVSTAADHDAVRRLYESIGRRVGGREHFETAAAAGVGRRVWSELHDFNGVTWWKGQ